MKEEQSHCCLLDTQSSLAGYNHQYYYHFIVVTIIAPLFCSLRSIYYCFKTVFVYEFVTCHSTKICYIREWALSGLITGFLSEYKHILY